MWNYRFFQSTRGKVLFLLKKRGPCTVAYLSHQLELTPNAIRQHLSSLERDNLVTQQPVKTGPNKPALADGYADRLINLTLEERVKEVDRIMEENVAIPDWEINDQGWTVRDFNCPYSATAKSHPGVCEVQRSFLQRLLHPAKVIIECQQQEGHCGFQVSP